MSLSIQTLNELEALLLGDKATFHLKGNEMPLFGRLVHAVQAERDAQVNAEKVTLRVRPVVVNDEGRNPVTE